MAPGDGGVPAAWLGVVEELRPFEPQTRRRTGYRIATHRLNKEKYHDNWLHNLYISASLGGFIN